MAHVLDVVLSFWDDFTEEEAEDLKNQLHKHASDFLVARNKRLGKRKKIKVKSNFSFDEE